MVKYEYRVAISDGPLSANQLNNEFGADGWELVDVIQHAYQGRSDSEPKLRFWNYFKRDKAPALSVVGKSSLSGGPLDRGRGRDHVEIQKG